MLNAITPWRLLGVITSRRGGLTLLSVGRTINVPGVLALRLFRAMIGVILVWFWNAYRLHMDSDL
jgi:hypothetical protein